MTFYIKPPEGNISLQKLHKDAETRLQFLHQIHQQLDEHDQIKKIFANDPNIALNSDCLIEGSSRDRVSHFILRLSSLKIRSFQSFLLESETLLFKFRILSGGRPALKPCLANLKRHASYALKNQLLSYHHREFLQHIREVVPLLHKSGILGCQLEVDCTHTFKVPWTMVNSMVRDRCVSVIKGEVEIHCNQLIAFLCSIFSDLLNYGLEELSSLTNNNDTDLSDQRMTSIKRSLRRTFSKIKGHGNLNIPSGLLSRDIPEESKFFPLCMRQLYQILSTSNRLRHHARLRFTLYLKDIGLPVDENISFWEHFYSKPYTGSTSSCSHSWNGRCGNRYKYSIRHVYGLEGGRINYSSHSCNALQGMKSQPNDMNGCPFSSSDHEETALILKTVYGDQPYLDKIMELVIAGKPNIACKLLMKYSLCSTIPTSSNCNVNSGNKLTVRNTSLYTKNAFSQENSPKENGRVRHSNFHEVKSCRNYSRKSLESLQCKVGKSMHIEGLTNKKKKYPEESTNPVTSSDEHLSCVARSKENVSPVTSSDELSRVICSKENISPVNSLRNDIYDTSHPCCQNCLKVINDHGSSVGIDCTNQTHSSCHYESVNDSVKRCSKGSARDLGLAGDSEPVCDIEDAVFVSRCNFYRPSQYYVQAKINRKCHCKAERYIQL